MQEQQYQQFLEQFSSLSQEQDFQLAFGALQDAVTNYNKASAQYTNVITSLASVSAAPLTLFPCCPDRRIACGTQAKSHLAAVEKQIQDVNQALLVGVDNGPLAAGVDFLSDQVQILKLQTLRWVSYFIRFSAYVLLEDAQSLDVAGLDAQAPSSWDSSLPSVATPDITSAVSAGTPSPLAFASVGAYQGLGRYSDTFANLRAYYASLHEQTLEGLDRLNGSPAPFNSVTYRLDSNTVSDFSGSMAAGIVYFSIKPGDLAFAELGLYAIFVTDFDIIVEGEDRNGERETPLCFDKCRLGAAGVRMGHAAKPTLRLSLLHLGHAQRVGRSGNIYNFNHDVRLAPYEYDITSTTAKPTILGTLSGTSSAVNSDLLSGSQGHW